jgi:hypothetical protein
MKRPELAAIYRTIIRLQSTWMMNEKGQINEKPGDDEAWGLIVCGLAYLDPDLDEARRFDATGQKLAQAHKILVSLKEQTARDLGLQIELAVKRGRSGVPWKQAAADLMLAVPLREPKKSVPEIAEMLQAHHVPKSSALVPRGRWTTRQIAECITGDKARALRVAQTSRSARRAK